MGYESREDSQQMDWRNYPRHNNQGSNEMSAPGNVDSYAPKSKQPNGNGSGEQAPAASPDAKAPPAPQLPSEPHVLASTIEGAVGRIGDIAALEMEHTADDIMEAAEHVAAQFRRLAIAMRKASEGHGKAASDFCARMRTSYDAVQKLSVAFAPRHEDGDDNDEETAGDAEPAAEEKPVPRFLLRDRQT